MTRSRVLWLVLALLALIAVAIVIAAWAFRSGPAPFLYEVGVGLEAPAESTPAGVGQDASAKEPNEARAARTAVDPLLGPDACGVRGRLLRGGEPVVGAEVCAVPRRPREDTAITLSDAEGRFGLALPPVRHRLVLRGAGVPRGFDIPKIDLRIPRVFDLGDLRVPESVTVTGRVVDEGGQPLAGARVTVRQGDDGLYSFHRFPECEGDRSVETDARGRFVFGELLPSTVAVRADHPERSTERREAKDFVEGRADLGDFVLRPAKPLRGFVVDPDGAPVSGARVIPGGSEFDPLQERGAVVTGQDGSFVLRRASYFGGLTVVKEGFEPEVHGYDSKVQPVRVRLSPAMPLDGRVVGAAGRAGTCRLEDPEDVIRRRTMNEFVHGQFYSPQPLAADGSFHVGHVPPGRWILSARVPGLGSVAPFEIETPVRGVLELVPAPDRRIDVTVVDERGEPVTNAQVIRVSIDDPGRFAKKSPEENARSWLGRWARETVKVDTAGKVTLVQPRHEGAGLVANAPLHGLTSAVCPAGEGDTEVRLVVPRFGVIAGRVEDARLARHVRMRVHASGVGETKRGTGASIDAGGAFVTAPVPAGRYRVRVYLAEAPRPDHPDGPPVFEPVPLMAGYGDGIDVEVEVTAGEITEVGLPAPEVGEVRGRVLAGGRPVAGAIVFAHVVGSTVYGELSELDIHSLKPHCVTRSDGRFTFFVGGARRFELRARGATAPAWCAPVPLTVSSGEIRQQDIHLPAATIRGRYYFGDVKPADRGDFTAQLHPISMAAEDPFAAASHVLPPYWNQQRQDLGADGAFAFEGVQPGTWILRVVRHHRICAQRVVTVTANEALDLGPLEPRLRVQPKLASALGPKYGVRWRRILEAAPDGLFVRTVTRKRVGWVWPSVASGRYRLQAIEVWRNRLGSGVLGEPIGDPVDLEVHEDGTCTPAVVWPEGLAK